MIFDMLLGTLPVVYIKDCSFERPVLALETKNTVIFAFFTVFVCLQVSFELHLNVHTFPTTLQPNDLLIK